MSNLYEFLRSRTWWTHVSGLTAIATTHAVMNSPYVSLAIALLTGFTQASHAYQAVKGKPQVTEADVKTALGKLDG